VVEVSGPITPVTADFLDEELARAASLGAPLVILKLDTPGGLLEATRRIVKSILASPVPVAVWVAPSGGRAASAGVFITLAGQVAAMAPGTNIGAAHPVSSGGGWGQGEEQEGEQEGPSTDSGRGESGGEGKKGKGTSSPDKGSVMEGKILNDTAAWARTLAEGRGRNGDWAEKAVRESVSIGEREALAEKVIDLVAADLPGLLAALEGREVEAAGKKLRLDLAGAVPEERAPDWRRRLLAALADPNVAYILLMLGIYGILFELYSPGAVLPGVVGALSLLLAFFSFQILPLNLAGVLLILLGVVLFLLEIKVTSYGLLGMGGVLSLFLGSLMLFKSAEPWLRLSLSLVLAATVVTSLFFLLVLAFAVRAARRRVVTGSEGLVGMEGVVESEGTVFVHGEIWKAVSDAPLPPGARVRVSSVEGLVLKVAPLPSPVPRP
jgi:membrane-bound serine protease (ClpP class)